MTYEYLLAQAKFEFKDSSIEVYNPNIAWYTRLSIFLATFNYRVCSTCVPMQKSDDAPVKDMGT